MRKYRIFYSFYVMHSKQFHSGVTELEYDELEFAYERIKAIIPSGCKIINIINLSKL
jgi:hypothetical protein